MKILILTPQLPYPAQQGTSLRNVHIIRGLAAEHEITLLSFLEEEQTADPAKIAPLVKLCQRIETVPVPPRTTGQRLRQLITTRRPDMAHRLHSPEFNIRLRQLLAETTFDIVQIEGIELARAIEIIRAASQCKIVFDDHNAETELQRRNMLTDLWQPRRWVAATYSWVQARRLARFESWACTQADWVTAVSTTDAYHLQSLILRPRSGQVSNPQSPISVIPNCIDVPQYQSDLTGFKRPPVANLSGLKFDLVFSGKMDYRPNVDAVLWFADEIWPRIQTIRPSTTWAVVGQKPHARLQRLQELNGVTVTGWVESVRPYIHNASVFIMPFRIGSGTRLKLIEAMAAGRAIISTPIGAEGFPVTHDQELLLAESGEEMVTAVLHLLNDAEKRKRLGTAAQTFAQQYDWRRVIPQFNQIYTQLLNEEEPE
ncbi:MAG: glycosyltransferase [Chloroflexi bacterium]|nr:glycosyltransferase [Chloroflexota bacterium]